MVLSAMSKLRIALVIAGGLLVGCGQHRVAGMAGRLTTEEFVAAVELLRTDNACRDSRIMDQWWSGATTQELVDAVLGYPTNTASLQPGESLRTFMTANGTASLRCFEIDGLPPEAPKALRLEVVNQIVSRPQPDVDVEKLKSRIVAAKRRIDPVDTVALATERRERWEEEEAARKVKEEEVRKLAEEQARQQAARVQAYYDRKKAAVEEESRRMNEEMAREYAEGQERGRDQSQADRDYIILRDKIPNRELQEKFSAQYLDWYQRRVVHLGEQRRLGLDRKSVPLPSLAAIEMAIKTGTGPVPVGE